MSIPLTTNFHKPMKDYIFLLMLLSSSLAISAQCFPDRHNTSDADAWMSCQISQNPNPERGSTHWVRYNLNAIYSLGQITFWNYNNPSHLDRGLNEVIIDYSLDGVEWLEWGTYTLDMATGSSTYEGDLGPDLDGLEAKDILITAVSNHGDNSCFALSEIKIEVIEVVSNTEDPTLAVDMSLSPNPTSGILAIAISSEKMNGKINYMVLNLEGKIVSTGNFLKSSTEYTHQLDLSALNNGAYYLELQTEAGNISKPFSVIK